MEIRVAKRVDFKEVDRLYQQLMKYIYDLRPYFMKGPGHFYLPQKMFQEWLDNDKQTIFVAENEEKIVGFANCLIKKAKENELIKSYNYVEIENLVIDNDYKKSGIGKQLIKKAEGWAKDHGTNTVRLSSAGANHNALEFYKHLGYEISSVTFHKDI